MRSIFRSRIGCGDGENELTNCDPKHKASDTSDLPAFVFWEPS
jgi:hypothetical protein